MTPRAVRPYTAFGFASTHDALAAEESLQAADVAVTPIPAPRELGSGCGIALRVSVEDSGRAERTIQQAGITVAGSVPI